MVAGCNLYNSDKTSSSRTAYFLVRLTCSLHLNGSSADKKLCFIDFLSWPHKADAVPGMHNLPHGFHLVKDVYRHPICFTFYYSSVSVYSLVLSSTLLTNEKGCYTFLIILRLSG